MEDNPESITNQTGNGICAVWKRDELRKFRYYLWTNVCCVLFVTMLGFTIANEIYGLINKFYPAKGEKPSDTWDDVLASTATGNLFLLIGLAIFGSVGVVQYATTALYCLVVPPLTDFIQNKLSDECDILSFSSNLFTAFFLLLQVTFYFCSYESIFDAKRSLFSQFSLMFVYATNFSMWIRHVVYEGVHTAQHIGGNNHSVSNNWLEYEDLISENTSNNYDMHSIFKGFEGPMWTCVVEYSMIAAAIGAIMHRRLKKYLKTTFDSETQTKRKFSVDWLSMSNSKCTMLIVFFFICLTFVLLTLVLITTTNESLADWIFNIGAVFIVNCALIACLSLAVLPEGEFDDNHDDVALDKILLYVGFIGSMIYSAGKFTRKILKIRVISEKYNDSFVKLQLVLQFHVILNWWEKIHCDDNHMWLMKILILLNVCLFVVDVLDANVASPNADSLKPSSSNGRWTVFVRVCVVFIIFFRFHSSVCLAEIWIEAKQHELTEHEANQGAAM